MKRLLNRYLILLCLLSSEQLLAAVLPVVHTCQQQVNSLLHHDGCLFGATTGGLFVNDTLAIDFSHYTVLDGLSENDNRRLAITEDGLLWCASAGAQLDLFEITGASGQNPGLVFTKMI